MKRAVILFGVLVLAFVSTAPSKGHADGPPVQTIARWGNNCVGDPLGSWDTEFIVRIALPGEMYAGSDPEEALKANASIIRQDAIYWHNNPEDEYLWSTFGPCPDNNYEYYPFDFRETRIQGVMEPNSTHPRTDSLIAQTRGEGWFNSGVFQTNFHFFPWGSEMQQCTRDMAGVGWEYRDIVGSGNWPPGVFSPSTPCPTEPVAPAYVFCHWDPSGKVDHDCDGYNSQAEDYIGTDTVGRCHAGFDSGPSPSWPSDFASGQIPDSTDRITITDLTSFMAPTRRLGTSPGNPKFNARWDLVLGPGIFGDWISVSDVTALIAGSTGFPPMFNYARAFTSGGNPTCTNHPVYGY